MSKRVFFGHNDIRFFYYRYKDSNYYALSIFALVTVACLMLVFFVIIPQAENYFSIRSEVVALRLKIKNINENSNFINNMDKSVLDSQLLVTTRALPTEKDFAGIIDVIAQSSIRSGVSVSDFGFRLDDKTVNSTSVNKGNNTDLLPISVAVDIKGSSDGGKKFIEEIQKKTPLVEITDVKGDSNSLLIGMNFYYKTPGKIKFDENEPITAISESQQALIKELTLWQAESSNPGIIEPIGSSSAMPLF
ncbi:MAG TPA: hypothetical protein VLG67_01610 [Candidatus Saccharimonadales bacterium]|nr:hypothetical protein [Candidatus Saccharimonadales bacterium]